MSGQVREKIFISYSHKDQKWLDAFQRMLKPAVHSAMLDVWSDRRISVGEDWHASIKAALEVARVALLLVTPEFLDSEFIARHELPAILEASRGRGLSIHWVPISPTLYDKSPLEPFQASWDPKRPLATLSESECSQAIHSICWDLCANLGQISRVEVTRRDGLRQDVQEQLPHLHVDEPIGSGHNSVVFRGRRRDGDTPVAIKVLIDSPLRECPCEHVLEHARIAKKLRHPAFIDIQEVKLDVRPHCIVSEFVDGVSLARTLESGGKFSVDRVIALLRQLTDALSEANQRGLVCGVINPSNVLMENGDKPRLSPFGFWTYLARDDDLAGNFMVNRETLSYMTPEHFNGWPVSEKTDQYALGLLALEMLEQVRPVTVRRPADFVRKQRFFERPLEFRDRPSASGSPWSRRHPGLAATLERMLQERPEERWESLETVAGRLRNLERESVVLAKNSYTACCSDPDTFWRAFYARLFRRCPDVEALFTSDQAVQRRMLNAAIQGLLNFGSDPVVEPTVLSAAVARHRPLPLEARHYEHFGEALLETLREEGQQDQEAIDAWACTIAPGLRYMQASVAPAESAVVKRVRPVLEADEPSSPTDVSQLVRAS